MLKLTVTVLGLALAASASAAGWRSLTIDGSSEATFTESVNSFKDKLPIQRRYAFAWALQDIWLKGVQDAEASQTEYTATDFFKQVDGLGYEQVVTLIDPTGAKEKSRIREAYARTAPPFASPARSMNYPPAPIGPHGEQVRGTVDSGPAYQHQLRQMGQ